MSDAIYEGIIRYIGKDSLTIFRDQFLSKSYEFDIVIIEVDLLFTKSLFVIDEEILNPL